MKVANLLLEQDRISVQQIAMDACSGKRSAGGLTKSKKGYNVGLKDAAAERDQNIQFCYRIGCSGRIKYSQNTKVGTSDISKCSKPSLRSLNRNKTYGDSSRGNYVITSAKELNSDSTRKVSSKLESYPSGGGLSGGSEALEPTPLPITSQTGKLTVTETGSSSASSSIRPQKISQIRSGLHKPIALPASSIPSDSRSPNQGPSKDGCGSRYGLKSLKCNSIPDVIPSSSSSFSKPVRKNLMDKKNPEREGFLSRRKTTAASSIDGNISPSNCSISIRDSRNSSRASGEVNNGVASFRTQRAVNINNRTRLSTRSNMRNSSSAWKPVSGSPQFSQSGTPINNGGSSSSQHFSASGFSSGSSSYSLSSINDDYQSTLMPLTSGELGFTQFMSHDALQLYNIDGVTELLLALERIERDEELTHEQILALDSSLFVGSLNIHDQHRDMRLDIDNMSYEELLALEDRMGSVSTAVPEEALTKCLRRSIYHQVTSSEIQASGLDEDGDNIKCSICQEDFALGDEIGALVECEHGYHITCIYQWLRLKNWCPICKVAAAPSESSSS